MHSFDNKFLPVEINNMQCQEVSSCDKKIFLHVVRDKKNFFIWQEIQTFKSNFVWVRRFRGSPTPRLPANIPPWCLSPPPCFLLTRLFLSSPQAKSLHRGASWGWGAHLQGVPKNALKIEKYLRLHTSYTYLSLGRQNWKINSTVVVQGGGWVRWGSAEPKIKFFFMKPSLM